MSVFNESRKSRLSHNVAVVAGIAFVFIGLVALPLTRASTWSASYSDAIVGP